VIDAYTCHSYSFAAIKAKSLDSKPVLFPIDACGMAKAIQQKQFQTSCRLDGK
jgi:hypothetical protein